MNIYDLPALIAIPYTNAVTSSNIQEGFKQPGYTVVLYLYLLTAKYFLTWTFCQDM